MTPKEEDQIVKKLRRYDHYFDPDVDRYVPPLKYIKSGALAKHQPYAPKMSKSYWQAQCSFRGLCTTGSIEELKDRVRGRDRSKDHAIKQELDKLQKVPDACHEQRIREELERWWSDPTTSIEAKVSSDARRALTELLEREPGVRSSFLIIRTRSTALEHWAKERGLACQTLEPPWSMKQEDFDPWTIIGKANLVQKEAKRLSKQADVEEKAAQVKAQKLMEQRRQAERARQAAMLEEAKNMKDWDITGSWTVECEDLAEYSEGPRAELSMKIYRDDFRFDDMRRDRSRPGMDQPNIPRYCATFDFAVVEGVMRIFPPAATRAKKSAFKVKDNPSFEYIWRGEETGEGEIQLGSDNDTFAMTFSNNGTSFRGTFQCAFLHTVDIIGSKVAHGRDQEYSSRSKWEEYSEEAYAEASVNRWR